MALIALGGTRSLALHAVPDLLRDQLQTTLGIGYTLARELGGGDMSGVFVARDRAAGITSVPCSTHQRQR